jgi:hypothetical protein
MIKLSKLGSCKPEFVARRLQDLGRHLGDVGDRVRLAVVDAIRATVADLARDAVDRVLHHAPGRSIPSPFREPRDEYDPWADDQDQREWAEAQDDYQPAQSTSHAPTQTAAGGSCALAVALAAAGWWLRQQGTVLGAVGIALFAAAAAAMTKRLTWDSLPLVEAASELLNLQRFLTVFATLLAKA